ncbi:Arp4p KNAG_0B01920 [Huiozyma naganishii CBS 8797]|uniref:Actin-related protein 4 n=1 Tax=Huiozyma naganishii (strain ATCC MYA-139 / BCRC 22969 / CBS 8797 / KCTC 17520 / NBRC 10181 / NCYC 3082 / Yp74L-3) TaxID=1071383 RepID=J7S3C0_HUIN7|nr:hypothetical protein KNAG_0B01920 [Kazachstania naganishii CBS 8797]CCK68634.1 hypothetical protein KNAG_0B01920 [Kazachstania naganishii CBS 8797]
MSNSTLQVYGGDEISAVVIDPGSYSTNIGYSGTDCPHSILPSRYGSFKKTNKDSGDEDTKSDESATKRAHIFSEQSLGLPRKDYEIKTIVENGAVTDWDAAQEQWEWALKNELFLESTKGIPALLTEPVWNTKKNRKKSLETLLESMNFEACYLAPTSTCVSFATGRANCLVVDIGHDTCSVSPVVDGMTLSKSTRRSFFAGKYINHLIENFLKPREIIPLFAVEQRRPEFKRKKFEYQVDLSLYTYANARGFFEECKETLLQITTTSSLEKIKPELESMSKRSIEAPWTENIVMDNVTRYGFGEQLFEVNKSDIPETWNIDKDGIVETFHNDYVPLKRNKFSAANKPDTAKENTPAPSVEPTGVASETANDVNENGKRNLEESNNGPELEPKDNNEIMGLADLVHSSIMASDVDLRASLAHNVQLTGGTSLIPGLSDRLMLELNARLPALKFRILTTGHKKEREYQSWLGGSVLTSLGTFHQLWVGRQEYEEVGADRLLNDRFR